MIVSQLLDGFATAATPINLLYATIGVLLGTAVGVLPGIGPAMTVALLLPVTYGMQPTSALIMFAGVCYGGMYGGSTTSILLNTPGESSSVVTAIEGNLMARKGRAAQALATAAIGSFVAGTIGTALLVLVAPVVTRLAVNMGAPGYFSVMLLTLLTVTAVLGSSRIPGFAALAIGLAIGLVGADKSSGQLRMTFGLPLFSDGIDIVVVAVAIFALGEALWVAAHLRRTTAQVIPVGQPWMGRQDWQRSWKPWLRGTALGFPFGALPAGGAEIPTFLSYVTEKRLTKHATSSVTAPSRVSPDRRPPTTPQRPAPWCRCCPSACPPTRPQRSCWPPSPDTGSCPARCCSRTSQNWCGPDRQPVHRQHAAALTEPAAGPGVGQAAADTPPVPVRRHPVLRQRRCLRGEPAVLRSDPAPGVRSGASVCGGSGYRSCR